MGSSVNTNLGVPPNVQVFFLRHARSVENDGQIFIVDAPLTSESRAQASNLSGQFDYVISSPMRRCLETLHYSSIRYSQVTIDHNFRERVFVDSSRMMLEHGTLWEPEDVFERRVKAFESGLKMLIAQWSALKTGPAIKRVLLIGHSYFFNEWAGRSKFSSVENGVIIRLA